MNVILFGATGMVGQGVLRECLLDSKVESILAIGRSATMQQHEKLREIVLNDLLISRRLKTDSRATTHAFSASAFQWRE